MAENKDKVASCSLLVRLGWGRMPKECPYYLGPRGLLWLLPGQILQL